MARKPFAKAVISTYATADVADGGTIDVPYPTGANQTTLTGSEGGIVSVGTNEVYMQGTGAGTVAFAFGASSVTVTNNTGVTWPAASQLIVSFGGFDLSDTMEV